MSTSFIFLSEVLSIKSVGVKGKETRSHSLIS